MYLVDILKNSGFNEEKPNEKYTRKLGEGFCIEAFIDGEGVIFHLIKDGNLIQPTIHTVDQTDLANAFNQLMSFLQSFVSSMSNMNNQQAFS